MSKGDADFIAALIGKDTRLFGGIPVPVPLDVAARRDVGKSDSIATRAHAREENGEPGNG